MDKSLQNPTILFPSESQGYTLLRRIGKKLSKNIKGFLSILALGLLFTGLTAKASSSVVPKNAGKHRTANTVSAFTDPAVGANITFTNGCSNTLLQNVNSGTATYTFTSADCDGNGFTATAVSTDVNNFASSTTQLIINTGNAAFHFLQMKTTGTAITSYGSFKSTSGIEFQLTNISIQPSTNLSQNITITAYKNNVLVAGSSVVVPFTGLSETTLTSTNLGSAYNDIDEIRLSSDASSGNRGFDIGNITTATAILPSTTINSINTVASSPTNATTVNYTATFGAAISGLTNTNFSLTTSGVTGASVGTPTTSDGGTTWTVPVNTGTGDGTIILNLANATSISPGISTTLPFAGQTYTIDKTAPSVSSINRVNATLNNASAEPFTATFSESVTGVDATDFTVTATGTVASTGISVTPLSASTYTVTVSGVTGDGTLRLDLNSSGTGITDAAGNAISGGFTTGQVYTIDHTSPTITLSAPSVASATTGPVSYTVTYADANFNSSTLTASNISLNTTGTAAGTISVSGSGTTRTATISGITGTGSLGITIAAGTATDLAGNSAPGAGPSGTFTVGPPPLDKLGLDASTPAAGAYSLRLLSSGYTGPLVRITIGSNYYDVYPDASASKSFSLNSPVSAAYSTYNAASTGASGTLLSTVIGVNSATVAIWYDQSGNSLNGLQSNTSTQPEIINAGVIDKSNALPALKFSGTQNMTVTSTAFNTDLSGSVVYNATSANTSSNSPAAWYVMNGIFSSEQPGGVYDFGYGVFNNKFTAGNGPSDNSVATTNNVNDGVTRQNSWTRNNSSGVVDLLTAGTDNHSATLNSGTRTSVPSVSIGSSQTASGATFFNGTISEMALFAIVYNTTQQQTVDNNQVTYYNIQVGPVISSTGTLSGLSTTYGTASASGNFTVSGTNMTAGILVTPPSGYQVSTDNSTFTNSITVGAAGTIAPTTVYIRIAANTPAGNITVANVVLSSSGAINANVSQPQSTVNQAALTVTANNQSKTYGAAIPTLTASYTGFVNGDNSASLTTQPTLTTTATAASPVNTYTITPSGAVDNNYAISYANGTLTIGQAALTVTADNQSKTYGQANPALTITYTGFVNGDTQASLTTAATAATTATAASPVNTYAITPSGAVDNNYAISYANGTLTIGQAALTITANNQSKTYGAAIPT
ncbi:MAG: Cadherin-like beta sandwich domain protein [Mucilaginibacter sp.]|nr:Cadherin-like beta sandwich domain protein [Mucilaginibacter sp.]